MYTKKEEQTLPFKMTLSSIIARIFYYKRVILNHSS